jgi:chromosome segregation ATPase
MCGKRLKRGLGNIGSLLLVLLLLSVACSLGAEEPENLYELLKTEFHNYDQQLSSLSSSFHRLSETTGLLDGSINEIENDLSELKQNSQQRENLLTSQDRRLTAAEKQLTNYDSQLTELDQSLKNTEKSLSRLKSANQGLWITIGVLGTLVLAEMVF